MVSKGSSRRAKLNKANIINNKLDISICSDQWGIIKDYKVNVIDKDKTHSILKMLCVAYAYAYASVIEDGSLVLDGKR